MPAALAPDLRRALAATERSERLIASLLALARGESGVLAASTTTDLADQARSAIADVRAEAEEAHVTLHARLHPAPVSGDTALIAQLVANLVTNAVRHNGPGGSVRITTGTAAGAGHDLAAHVEVRNTGPVVNEADVPTLFEPFRRGSRQGKGSGLGLSVVRAVTETHHGTLTARPNLSGGLTLRVELPSRGA